MIAMGVVGLLVLGLLYWKFAAPAPQPQVVYQPPPPQAAAPPAGGGGEAPAEGGEGGA